MIHAAHILLAWTGQLRSLPGLKFSNESWAIPGRSLAKESSLCKRPWKCQAGGHGRGSGPMGPLEVPRTAPSVGVTPQPLKTEARESTGSLVF